MTTDRPLKIATYAVGASLAAASLLYVFGPTFTLDASIPSNARIVGLENPSNLCFINSVLQALANTPELRKYLILEVHRRDLDGKHVYAGREEEASSIKTLKKLDDLRRGLVTNAMKKMLDRLNERPLQRKTISALPFIRVLEEGLVARISRQQQDAQEFLQVVLERLHDEYRAGIQARIKHQSRTSQPDLMDAYQSRETKEKETAEAERVELSDPFPFEGKLEAHITCEICGFKPKSHLSPFVTVTLNVPQKSDATLNECLDGLMKIERILDFKCDKCKLSHAQDLKLRQLARTPDVRERVKLESELSIIEDTLKTDPEKTIPSAVRMPKDTPSSRIARSMTWHTFPKVLVIHLSRSIYSTMSSKNTAKVAFQEQLQIGPITNLQNYSLISVICHKGGHSSGHYQTFRRQSPAVPVSTPISLGKSGPLSARSSPIPSTPPSAAASARTDTPSPTNTSIYAQSEQETFGNDTPDTTDTASSTSNSLRKSVLEQQMARNQGVEGDENRKKLEKKRKRLAQRWWRISDDRIKDTRVNEVLGMQREVYLLFYELVARSSSVNDQE